MKDEILIEQLAEIRAAQFITNYMLHSFLQHSGCDPESLLRSADILNRRMADNMENQMRKACGLDPRPEPRPSIIDQAIAEEQLRSIDWDKVKEN